MQNPFAWDQALIPLSGHTSIIKFTQGGNEMDKQTPLTAGELAGQLTAKELEPLVKYVEEATGVKLRQNEKKPLKPTKPQR